MTILDKKTLNSYPSHKPVSLSGISHPIWQSHHDQLRISNSILDRHTLHSSLDQVEWMSTDGSRNTGGDAGKQLLECSPFVLISRNCAHTSFCRRHISRLWEKSSVLCIGSRQHFVPTDLQLAALEFPPPKAGQVEPEFMRFRHLLRIF